MRWLVLLSVLWVAGCRQTGSTDAPDARGDSPARSPARAANSDIPSDNQTRGTENANLLTGYAEPGFLKSANYVNDRLCADCHRDLYESYQQLGMAQAFYDFSARPTIEAFDEGHYFHPASKNHYEMRSVEGELELTRYRLREDGRRTLVHRQRGQYVVGSGNHVRTYLYRNNAGELYQLPVVWYSREKKWGMAPGYDRPDHPDFSRPITRHCLFCHNAYPAHEPGSDQFAMPNRFPVELPQGIGCQRCHGPGSEHVRISDSSDWDDAVQLTRVNDSIVNPAKLPVDRQDDVCNQCHLQPMSQRTSFVRQFERSDYDFHAGQSLADFMLYFEPDRNNDVADHFEINHHPYRLRQSQCFTQTPGGIRCTHCHDPHAKVAVADQADFYRPKCLACHGPQDCQDEVRGRTADADCIACHMPLRRTSDVVHVTMTDHKIVRRPGLAAPTAMLEEIDVPIDMPIRRYSFNANSTIPTDQEKVYELFIRLVDDDDSAVELLAKVLADSPADFSIPRYQLMQKWLGDGKFDAAAKLLKSLEGPFADFFAFHTNYAAQKIGTDRFDEVSRHLNRAMEIDPEQPAAWYHLGLFESKRPDADQAKNSQSAIASFQRAIELRPTYTKARIKLGHLYATQDRLELAAEQFLWAVNFDVGNVEATTSLAAVYRRLGHWNLATATLLDGLAIRPHQTKLLRAASILLLSPENALTPPAREGLSFANRWRDAAPDDVDAQLVLALALLKNGDFRESLQIAADVGLGDRRRPEAGLIMAACQKQLGLQSPTGAKGTLAAAEKNYTGALQAIDAAPIDQIGDLIRSIAVQAYGSNLTDQNSN